MSTFVATFFPRKNSGWELAKPLMASLLRKAKIQAAVISVPMISPGQEMSTHHSSLLDGCAMDSQDWSHTHELRPMPNLHMKSGSLMSPPSSTSIIASTMSARQTAMMAQNRFQLMARSPVSIFQTASPSPLFHVSAINEPDHVDEQHGSGSAEKGRAVWNKECQQYSGGHETQKRKADLLCEGHCNSVLAGPAQA
ncbi:hypothetical protein [Arthrobacter citreus]|uniref:hypothetical protein n=1 Tax=Arthrobacter citreus TaxID=1670 RepID=UPI0038229F6F